MVPAPRRLRVEHLEEALGIDVVAPRLSWQLAEAATKQEAFRLDVGAWSSGWIESDACVLVPYAGPPIGSRTRVEWRVQVRTDAGLSEWSQWSWWETGLVATTDWTARVDRAARGGPTPGGGRGPASVLRTRFSVRGDHQHARIYATAHGLYELYLDGERVGDQELTPGFTVDRSRGTGADLRRGRTPRCRRARAARRVVRRLVPRQGGLHARTRRLRITARDRSRRLRSTAPSSATDATWTSASSAIVAVDLIDGEACDQRIHDDALEWRPVEVVDGDFSAVARRRPLRCVGSSTSAREVCTSWAPVVTSSTSVRTSMDGSASPIPARTAPSSR